MYIWKRVQNEFTLDLYDITSYDNTILKRNIYKPTIPNTKAKYVGIINHTKPKDFTGVELLMNIFYEHVDNNGGLEADYVYYCTIPFYIHGFLHDGVLKLKDVLYNRINPFMAALSEVIYNIIIENNYTENNINISISYDYYIYNHNKLIGAYTVGVIDIYDIEIKTKNDSCEEEKHSKLTLNIHKSKCDNIFSNNISKSDDNSYILDAIYNVSQVKAVMPMKITKTINNDITKFVFESLNYNTTIESVQYDIQNFNLHFVSPIVITQHLTIPRNIFNKLGKQINREDLYNQYYQTFYKLYNYKKTYFEFISLAIILAAVSSRSDLIITTGMVSNYILLPIGRNSLIRLHQDVDYDYFYNEYNKFTNKYGVNIIANGMYNNALFILGTQEDSKLDKYIMLLINSFAQSTLENVNFEQGYILSIKEYMFNKQQITINNDALIFDVTKKITVSTFDIQNIISFNNKLLFRLHKKLYIQDLDHIFVNNKYCILTHNNFNPSLTTIIKPMISIIGTKSNSDYVNLVILFTNGLKYLQLNGTYTIKDYIEDTFGIKSNTIPEHSIHEKQLSINKEKIMKSIVLSRQKEVNNKKNSL